MGSKKSMLKNGLGRLLDSQIPNAHRFVDLFTGSGFVSWYVAEKMNTPVLAVDLQEYATVLAGSVIKRTIGINSKKLYEIWIEKSIKDRNNSSFWKRISSKVWDISHIKEWVRVSRELCKTQSNIGPCFNAYSGYYFSPQQSLTIDYLLANLPKKEPYQTACLAALISATSECVASPGHTAQPFQPTDSASPYIYEAWRRDPAIYCKKALDFICPKKALVKGETITGNALQISNDLRADDVVFIDPPYSSVQYSRFYHVLETIARKKSEVEVFGRGRYTSLKERPQSSFSNISQSKNALEKLLITLSSRGCNIIFTFPRGIASNGLSGDYIKESAAKWFNVEDHTIIEGKFSTLGGNNHKRDARVKSSEMVLFLKSK